MPAKTEPQDGKQYTVTNQEIAAIEKYRTLDERGRRIINFILNEEYDRCTELRLTAKEAIQ